MSFHMNTNIVNMNICYILFTAKARSFVACCECQKRRVIYSNSRLSHAQETALAILKENRLYVCGDTLFPDGHEETDCIIVREGIGCEDPIEVPYYSGIKKYKLHNTVGNIQFVLEYFIY